MADTRSLNSGLCNFCDAILKFTSGQGSSPCHGSQGSLEDYQSDCSDEGLLPHHKSRCSLEHSQMSCWLCALFVKSLDQEPDPGHRNDSWYSSSALYRNDPNRERVRIEVLSSAGFSGDVRFTYLRPHRGHGTDLKKGTIVLILPDNEDLDALRTREIWRVGHTQPWSNARRLSVVSDWLSDCHKNHEQCKSDSSVGGRVLPTRVIDVSSHPVRLHEPSKPEVAPYAALSYCWGDPKAGDVNIETTATTIERRKANLFLEHERVPSTIQDAIDITKRLGIRYLWIDALCIIQGDKKDWENEAAKMHSVYENAEITLSATESRGCSRGFFPMSTSAVQCAASESSSFMEAHDFGSQRLYACLSNVKSDIHQSLVDSPLGARGWTFQETVLSRRLVHFSRKQLIWECGTRECGTHIRTEDGMLAWNTVQIPPDFFQSANADSDPYQSWEAVVKNYSRRRVQNKADRVYALAGVISQFQQLTQDEPMLGLWRTKMARGLLWFAPTPFEGPRVPKLSDVPSWSWMSVEGGVQYHTISHGDECSSSTSTDWISEKAKLLEPNSTTVKWAGKPLTSRVTSATLTLQGLVTTFRYLEKHGDLFTAYIDRQGDSPTSALLVMTARRVEYRGGDSADDTASRATVEDFYFLLLSSSHQRNRNTYRRVGMGVFKGNALRRYFELKKEDATLKTVVLS